MNTPIEPNINRLHHDGYVEQSRHTLSGPFRDGCQLVRYLNERRHQTVYVLVGPEGHLIEVLREIKLDGALGD
jgi:hypothetical protein